MSFMWMIIVGLIASGIAKLLMPMQAARGLFVLGIGGSMIAGMMQYAEGQPTGIMAPSVGAIILLTVYATIAHHRAAEATTTHEQHRRAA